MNRTSRRVRISISLRNRFSNSLHTFGKLMQLLECLQTLKRGVAETSAHETSIDAIVVVLFARWSLFFAVCGHAYNLPDLGDQAAPGIRLCADPWSEGPATAQRPGLALQRGIVQA